MFTLSIAVAIIIGAVAFLHFYWVFGGRYGINSSAPRVEGKSGFKPGRMLTFFVACLLAGLAVLAVQLTSPWQPIKELVPYAGYCVSVVFVIRAIGDFRYIGFFKRKYNSHFARLDTKYFSPLILLLGLAYAVLSQYGT